MNELDRLHLKIAKCSKCKTIVDYKKFSFSAHGNSASKNMIISEAPGRVSISNDKFWTGPAGNLLRTCLEQANLQLESDFYVTDVVKCWPNRGGQNRKPNPHEINTCKPFIDQEIELLNVENIFAFGETSIRLFIWNGSIKIKDLHGKSIKLNGGTSLYFFYHPSYITRQRKEIEYEYRSLLIDTFSKLTSRF